MAGLILKKKMMFVHCDQFDNDFLNLSSYIPDFVSHDLSIYVKKRLKKNMLLAFFSFNSPS